MKTIGLMGCGTVASYGHIPAMLKTDGLRLTSLYDSDPTRLKTAQEKFGMESKALTPAVFGSRIKTRY
ncbi:MAG: hypothetical protein NTX50_14795 [Candidatus Sumerlaeota bacterium]|nr:hypothetical protein [Candidatus Sumerlaeota bacterium]